MGNCWELTNNSSAIHNIFINRLRLRLRNDKFSISDRYLIEQEIFKEYTMSYAVQRVTVTWV